MTSIDHSIATRSSCDQTRLSASVIKLLSNCLVTRRGNAYGKPGCRPTRSAVARRVLQVDTVKRAHKKPAHKKRANKKTHHKKLVNKRISYAVDKKAERRLRWPNMDLAQHQRNARRQRAQNRVPPTDTHSRTRARQSIRQVPEPPMYATLDRDHAKACCDLQRDLTSSNIKMHIYNHRAGNNLHKGEAKFKVTPEKLLARLVKQGHFCWRPSPSAAWARVTPACLGPRGECRVLVGDTSRAALDLVTEAAEFTFPQRLPLKPAPADESSDARAQRMGRLLVPTAADHALTLDLNLRNSMALEQGGWAPENIHVAEMNPLHFLWMKATGCRYNIVFTPAGFEAFVLSPRFETTCCPRARLVSLHADYCGEIPTKLYAVARSLPNLRVFAATHSRRRTGPNGETLMFLLPGYIVQAYEGAGSVCHICTRDRSLLTREQIEAAACSTGAYY